MKKRLLAIILGIAVIMTFTPVLTFASDNDCIKLITPEDNSIWYIGETFYGKFRIYNPWKKYVTIPAIVITESHGEVVDIIENDEVVESGSWTERTCTFKIDDKFLPGQHTVSVLAAPMLRDDENAFIKDFDVPEKHYTIYIRRLGKPASVGLKTGRGKVTVSWAKDPDAQKYQVYRSTKKSSGYSRFATTAKKSFVDKKVKKGKRYFYKVRAVRAGNGTIYGAFTAPKQSGKVR